MTPRDADPLTIIDDHGYPLVSIPARTAFDLGRIHAAYEWRGPLPRRSSRAIPVAIAALAFILGFAFGVSLVRAAPRPAHLSAIPVVDDGRTGAPRPLATPAESVDLRAGDPATSAAAPQDAGRAVGKAGGGQVGRESFAAAPALSGTASWYPARGLIAAAGPGLRHGAWRGSSVTVSANGHSVTVMLADWCQCYGSRLLDLSDDAFAQLAPLSRGIVRVTVVGVGPAPTLPATDSAEQAEAAIRRLA